MPDFVPMSISAQVASYLRGELRSGRWRETIPGKHTLAADLGVNNKTVEAALIQLEREGLLVSQGRGRRRRLGKLEQKPTENLRVAFVPFGDDSSTNILLLHRALAATGDTLFTSTASVLDLGTSTKKMENLVSGTAADAWIISSGTRELLTWFCARPEPTFALFGRKDGLPIPSIAPDKSAAFGDTTRHLLKLGHQRIVFLRRTLGEKREISLAERAFLAELVEHGLTIGEFNVPEWENNEQGFHDMLSNLFRHTPPTALIADEPSIYTAILHYCSKRGLKVPEDLSLVCTDPDENFEWCRPSVAHIAWNPTSVVRCLARWISNVKLGVEDVHQTLTTARYIKGDTVAPAPRT